MKRNSCIIFRLFHTSFLSFYLLCLSVFVYLFSLSPFFSFFLFFSLSFSFILSASLSLFLLHSLPLFHILFLLYISILPHQCRNPSTLFLQQFPKHHPLSSPQKPFLTLNAKPPLSTLNTKRYLTLLPFSPNPSFPPLNPLPLSLVSLIAGH